MPAWLPESMLESSRKLASRYSLLLRGCSFLVDSGRFGLSLRECRQSSPSSRFRTSSAPATSNFPSASRSSPSRTARQVPSHAASVGQVRNTQAACSPRPRCWATEKKSCLAGLRNVKAEMMRIKHQGWRRGSCWQPELTRHRARRLWAVLLLRAGAVPGPDLPNAEPQGAAEPGWDGVRATPCVYACIGSAWLGRRGAHGPQRSSQGVVTRREARGRGAAKPRRGARRSGSEAWRNRWGGTIINRHLTIINRQRGMEDGCPHA